MGLSDHNSYNITDEFPGRKLKGIFPMSQRMLSMYARVEDRTTIKSMTPQNIFAVIRMVGGLEYHYKNFKSLTESIPTYAARLFNVDEQQTITNAKYEATAYINTVGQLYYWCRSLNETANLITRLTKSFRHKYTAHLSWHLKDENETDYIREIHAMTFSSTIWNGENEIIFQNQLEPGKTTFFNLVQEHPQILIEIQRVFQRALKN